MIIRFGFPKVMLGRSKPIQHDWLTTLLKARVIKRYKLEIHLILNIGWKQRDNYKFVLVVDNKVELIPLALGWWTKNLSSNEPFELDVDAHWYYTTNKNSIIQYWNPNWRYFQDGFINRLVYLKVCSSQHMEGSERILETLHAPIWSWQIDLAAIHAHKSSHYNSSPLFTFLAYFLVSYTSLLDVFLVLQCKHWSRVFTPKTNIMWSKKSKKNCQAWFTWKGCVHIVTLPPKLLINSVCGHKFGDHSRN